MLWIARVAIKIFAQKTDDEWKVLLDVLEPHFTIWHQKQITTTWDVRRDVNDNQSWHETEEKQTWLDPCPKKSLEKTEAIKTEYGF